MEEIVGRQYLDDIHSVKFQYATLNFQMNATVSHKATGAAPREDERHLLCNFCQDGRSVQVFVQIELENNTQ